VNRALGGPAGARPRPVAAPVTAGHAIPIARPVELLPAYWCPPEAYLDHPVRALTDGPATLAADLGRFDAGYRLVVSDLP
jgi:hypothetical protein